MPVKRRAWCLPCMCPTADGHEDPKGMGCSLPCFFLENVAVLFWGFCVAAARLCNRHRSTLSADKCALACEWQSSSLLSLQAPEGEYQLVADLVSQSKQRYKLDRLSIWRSGPVAAMDLRQIAVAHERETWRPDDVIVLLFCQLAAAAQHWKTSGLGSGYRLPWRGWLAHCDSFFGPLPLSGSSVLHPQLVPLLQARTFNLDFGFPGKLFGPGSSRGQSTLPVGLGMCVSALLGDPMLAASAHIRRYMPRFWEKSHAFHVPHVRRSVAYFLQPLLQRCVQRIRYWLPAPHTHERSSCYNFASSDLGNPDVSALCRSTSFENLRTRL